MSARCRSLVAAEVDACFCGRPMRPIGCYQMIGSFCIALMRWKTVDTRKLKFLSRCIELKFWRGGRRGVTATATNCSCRNNNDLDLLIDHSINSPYHQCDHASLTECLLICLLNALTLLADSSQRPDTICNNSQHHYDQPILCCVCSCC